MHSSTDPFAACVHCNGVGGGSGEEHMFLVGHAGQQAHWWNIE